MTIKETEIWEVITSVLNGTGTDEQQLLLNIWINENDENKKTFDLLSKVRRIGSQPSEDEKENIFERIHSEIIKKRIPMRLKLMKYGNIASVFIIMSLCIALFWPKTGTQTISIETKCPFGTKSKVILSDGTIVHLNSGSILEYPSIFAVTSREVKLKGEAFFEVTHESKREFIVKTGEIDIKVFGTRFNVKNYETDKVIQTTLVEGSVGILKKDDINHKAVLILKPNEQAVFEKKSRKLSSRHLDAELVAIWKDGKIFFEDEPLETIAQSLEREFNKPIIIASRELCKEVYSGIFDKNRTLNQILDLMKRKRNFSYKEVKDTIVINKN